MPAGHAWSATALLFALFAISALPAQAGTADAPEITDGSNDHELLGAVPITTQPPGGITTVGLNADLTKAWVEEAADHVLLNIAFQGNGGPSTNAEYTWTFHLEVAGTAYDATATQNMASQQGTGQLGNGQIAPGGVATEATIGDKLLVLKVPKAGIGSPGPGAVMTNLFVLCEAQLLGVVPDWITDRAPDSGAGADFTFAGSPGGGGDASDTDSDGLNDTWEQENFGSLDENGTGDPDGDNRTNAQEFASGTDPNEPDTDGDGLDDGAEVEAGTNSTNPDSDGDGFQDGEEAEAGSDPLDPQDTPDSGEDGGDDGSDGGDDGTDDGSGDDGSDGGSGSDDADGEAGGEAEKGTLDEYVDAIKADTGYAGASAAGMAAVLVLSIIGLAGRWGL